MSAVRRQAASILVAALASAFGVALLQITGAIGAVVAADDVTGSSNTVALMLRILAAVFIVIAVYVAAIVTANTFATIVAGRVRQIALMRLLGASARSQRGSIAVEGLRAGIIGSILGLLVGTCVAVLVDRIAVWTETYSDAGYGFTEWVVLIPVVAVVFTTWLAAWAGTRGVTVVTPLQALGRAEETSAATIAARPGRNRFALVLAIVGTAVLLLGVLVGLASPLGILVGLFGGIRSFTGIVLGADVVMPPVLRAVGRMLGRSAAVRLAAENSLRHPERSSRSTIGLVVGVTLVTMFGVAMASFEAMVNAAQEQNPEVYGGTDPVLAATTAVFSVLVGFSGLIAAVGLVNTLTLSVLQRRRELGLLRALGFSSGQVRGMILAESAQLTIAAVLLGLVLGAFYGWCGAQSLLGSASGFVVPGIPWILLGVVAIAAAVLTAVASWSPTRTALRVTPLEALAAE